VSFFILRDEFQISTEKTASWYVLEGVEKEFNPLWNIFAAVSKEWTASWNILGYVEREFTALWSIGYYISREFNCLWNISMQFGGKVKYSFSKARAVTRFFKRERNG